jgi:hypothetical protein
MSSKVRPYFVFETFRHFRRNNYVTVYKLSNEDIVTYVRFPWFNNFSSATTME